MSPPCPLPIPLPDTEMYRSLREILHDQYPMNKHCRHPADVSETEVSTAQQRTDARDMSPRDPMAAIARTGGSYREMLKKK